MKPHRKHRGFVTEQNLKIPVHALEVRSADYRADLRVPIVTGPPPIVYINIIHTLFHISNRLKTPIQTNPIS